MLSSQLMWRTNRPVGLWFRLVGRPGSLMVNGVDLIFADVPLQCSSAKTSTCSWEWNTGRYGFAASIRTTTQIFLTTGFSRCMTTAMALYRSCHSATTGRCYSAAATTEISSRTSSTTTFLVPQTKLKKPGVLASW